MVKLYERSVAELIVEAAAHAEYPTSRADLVAWFAEHYPQVKASTASEPSKAWSTSSPVVTLIAQPPIRKLSRSRFGRGRVSMTTTAASISGKRGQAREEEDVTHCRASPQGRRGARRRAR